VCELKHDLNTDRVVCTIEKSSTLTLGEAAHIAKLIVPTRSTDDDFGPSGEAGAEVRLLKVRETVPEAVIAGQPAWKAQAEKSAAVAHATPDDMATCILAPEAAGEGTYAHVEELEADIRALRGTKAERFLEECGLSGAAIADALERARGIAADFQTAVLAVHLAPSSATVIVTPPDPGARVVTLSQHQEPAVPLLQASPGA